MQGEIKANELKTLEELRAIKNPFERIDYKVKTIITVFGECANNKYYFNKFNLNITYIETINENFYSTFIQIKYLDDIVYDSEKSIYKSNRWETMLDVLFNVSHAVLKQRKNNKIKRFGEKKNDLVILLLCKYC